MSASATSPASQDWQAQLSENRLGSSAQAYRDDALLSPLVSTGRSGLGGHQVLRSPGALRLHPAFNELNLAAWLINSELQGKFQDAHEPILMTKSNIIVAGFAEWHAAVCAGQVEIVCIECALDQDEALQVILTLHRPRIGWNDFTRTELALEQERYFQSKALSNQVAGGKYKGLANLPKAEQIDVREKIADLAGVSPRTVGNVKIILRTGHPCLVEALHKGMITINAALQLCKFERSKQVEALALFLGANPNNKTNREYIDKLRIDILGADVTVFLANLRQFEAINPGSVELRAGKGKKTVVIVGKGHLDTLAGTQQACDEL